MDMERKLIKQGLGGYTVYLPKKWLDEHGFDKGGSIDIIEEGNKLIIGGTGNKKNEISFKLSDDNRGDIKHILTHLYRAGIDKIIFENAENKDIKEIRQVVQNTLLGFEITNTKNSVIVESLSDSQEDKYDMMIRRIFMILEEQHKVLSEGLENKFNNFEEMQTLRNDLDKFLLFCRRLLTKQKAGTFPVYEWELLTSIMQISHNYYYLYQYANEEKVDISKGVIELNKELKNYLFLFIKAYNEKKIDYIHQINSNKKKVHFSSCLDLLAKGKGNSNVLVSYMRELFRQIQLGTSPVLSIILKSDINAHH